MREKTKRRCEWAGDDPLYVKYHDEEWGTPVHEDGKLFEMFILEGAQAGLSWSTILKKRGNFKKAFDNFDARKIAKYDKKKIRELLSDEGIVRNRLKIEAAVKNAKAFLEVTKEFGTFDTYIWRFVDYRPVKNRWRTIQEIPSKTDISGAMSKDLKKRGFTFAGSTICYAFMQAVGMVNDHVTTCFRHKELS